VQTNDNSHNTNDKIVHCFLSMILSTIPRWIRFYFGRKTRSHDVCWKSFSGKIGPTQGVCISCWKKTGAGETERQKSIVYYKFAHKISENIEFIWELIMQSVTKWKCSAHLKKLMLRMKWNIIVLCQI